MATYTFSVVSPSGDSSRVSARSPQAAASKVAKEYSLPAVFDYPNHRDGHLPRWRVSLISNGESEEVTPTWLLVCREA